MNNRHGGRYYLGPFLYEGHPCNALTSGVHVRWTRTNVLRCMETYTRVVMGESGDTYIPKMKLIQWSAAYSSTPTNLICLICKSVISNCALTL